MLEDGERKCVCQRWGAISSNYSAPDNLADGDDGSDGDDASSGDDMRNCDNG